MSGFYSFANRDIAVFYFCGKSAFHFYNPIKLYAAFVINNYVKIALRSCIIRYVNTAVISMQGQVTSGIKLSVLLNDNILIILLIVSLH